MPDFSAPVVRTTRFPAGSCDIPDSAPPWRVACTQLTDAVRLSGLFPG
jgi:hypothetical protein